MISKHDLEIKRTPDELSAFVKSTFDAIRADENTRKTARLRKPPYKELIEEVYPLSVFCSLKYSNNGVLCSPVIGSQGFDAVIESPQGDLVEHVELSWPIDGQKAHFAAKELNENGVTKLEIRDVNDPSPRDAIIERIVNKAIDKALKDYSTDKGSSIVFMVGTAPYFGMSKIEYPDDIGRLVESIKNISFKVSNVYLLLLPLKELIEIK
jgi:hypothetical protein